MSGAEGVAACVAAHRSWMADRAGHGGVWRYGAIVWALVPGERTLHALFPDEVGADAARRALRAAREHGARSVAIWSPRNEERPWLADAGFEVGWQPWWMTLTDLVSVAEVPQRRVRVVEVPTGCAAPGSVGPVARTWRGEASSGGRRVGAAWLHLVGDVAGLFDMGVDPGQRRRGLGRELVAGLVAAGAAAGARVVALNATPEGAGLYRTLGFRHHGEGRTWWAHLAAGDERRPAPAGR